MTSMGLRLGAMSLACVAGSTFAASAQDFVQSCAVLSQTAPEPAGRVTDARIVEAGEVELMSGVRGPGYAPRHCLVRGFLQERTGVDGKPYAIGYEVRLPEEWNGKFFFQGGGGMDGVLREAVGVLSGAPADNALSRGYAVASTDAGHLAEEGPLGAFQFGLDPQARLDKGHTSIPPVHAAATSLMQEVFQAAPERSYFVGCSNGGKQAMAATQHYPELFDGVVAGAPAYRVPLASVDAVHQTQLSASLADDPSAPDLGATLTQEDLDVVAHRVLAQCDALDGLEDGMVFDMEGCRFDAAALACGADGGSDCLTADKANVLAEMFAGAEDEAGANIYATWPFDPGIASTGWRFWRLGNPGGEGPPPLNATLIPGAIAYVFNAPPETPQNLLDYTLSYDIATEPAKMYETRDGFPGGIEFETAMSPDVDAYKTGGGKILFFHGVADPIFSARDTVAYLEQLEHRYGPEDTADFARLFLVPGMTHCAGGPATDRFDTLVALETWVEEGEAPERLPATAVERPDVPWPGRTRPLCAWPDVPTYNAGGPPEQASSFVCR